MPVATNLERLIRASDWLMRVLATVRDAQVPDWVGRRGCPA